MSISAITQPPGYLLADVKKNNKISTLFPRFGLTQAQQNYQNRLNSARSEAERLYGLEQDAFTRRQQVNNNAQSAQNNYNEARQKYLNLQQQGQNGTY